MPGRRNLPTPPERPQFDLEYDHGAYEAAPSEGDARRRPPQGRRNEYGDRGREDAGLFRMLGVLILVSALVVALVLPQSPVRVVDRFGGTSHSEAGEGISAQARGDLPALPGGFSAVSRLYDLTIPAGLEGPQVIEVALRESTTDVGGLAFYSYEEGTWKRLAPATVSADGRHASGDLPYPPTSVAVLRSTVSTRSLALIVDGGQAPDPAAVAAASMVAVRGATVRDAKSVVVGDGVLKVAAQAAPGKSIYLAVGQGDHAGATAAFLGADLASAIVASAKVQGAAGVVMDLGVLPKEQRAAVTRFAGELSTRLRADRLGFLVAVPAAGRDGGAYDWGALLTISDGLWLTPRVDSGAYYPEVDTALAGAREAGIDLSRVTLVVDRRSQEVASGQRTLMTRRDALGLASTIQRQADSTSGGATVSMSAPFLAGTGGGLRWDDSAKAVGFSFAEGASTHHVWVENRFSVAFRLDLAQRQGLGGVAVDQAMADESLADVWGSVLPLAEGTAPGLERPYGRYLVPCWEAKGGGTIEGMSGCWQQDVAAPSAVWRAPANAGAYTVRLVVSDGVAFVGQEMAIRVAQGGRAEPPAASPSPSPTVTGTPRPGGGTSVPPGPSGN